MNRPDSKKRLALTLSVILTGLALSFSMFNPAASHAAGPPPAGASLPPLPADNGGQEAASLRNFKFGDKLPPFTLKTIDGQGPKTFTPGADGKPSLIIFFSVRPEFREKRSLALLSAMAAMADQYKNKVEIVGVFSDSQGGQVVRDYVKPFGNKLVVYDDPALEVNNQYGAFMMPLAIMCTKTGTLHEVIPYTYNIRELIDGNFKLLLGEFTKEQLQAALNPQPNAPKTEAEKEYIRRVNYGKIMQGKRMYAQAVREFNTAIKINPKNQEAYVELGFAEIALKDWDKAEEAFTNAKAINKDSDDALAGLGLAYYGKGNIDKALPELENALISPEPRLEVIIALADIYEKRGDNAKSNRLNKLAVAKLMAMYDQRWK